MFENSASEKLGVALDLGRISPSFVKITCLPLHSPECRKYILKRDSRLEKLDL